jgi:hypothetical protein
MWDVLDKLVNTVRYVHTSRPAVIKSEYASWSYVLYQRACPVICLLSPSIPFEYEISDKSQL